MGRKKGCIPWNKGKTNIYSEDTLQRNRDAHLGKIPWNKGKTGIYSKETLQKMRDTKAKYFETHSGHNKGKKPSEKSIKKMVATRRLRNNYKHSEKTKRKIKEGIAKHYKIHDSVLKGKKHSEERSQKTSVGLKKYYETNDSHLKGTKQSKEHQEKKSKSVEEYYKTHDGYWKDKKHSEETKQKFRDKWKNKEYMKHQLSTNPFFDRYIVRPTGIELLVLAELIQRGIYNFIPEFKISNGNGGFYFIDFFVLPNLFIEADGDYWHSLPRIKKLDKIKNQYFDSKNYKVLRFTETQINNNLNQIGNVIESNIGGILNG